MAARITIGAVLFVLLAWPAAAATLELKDFNAKDEAKKVLFTFNLSEAAEAQVISNYQSNFVAVSVAKLRFPRQLLKADHPPADEATLQFYRFVRFQQTESEGQIRLYLGKLATPADVQVVQLEDRIEVELIKPLWKLEAAPAASAAENPAAGLEPAATAAGVEPPAAADGGFRETQPADSAEPAGFIPDADAAGDEPASVPEPALEPAAAADADSAAAEATEAAVPAATADRQDGESYGQTQFDEVFGTDADEPEAADALPGAGAAEPADASPVLDMAPQPSYRQFDLSRVPVSQVEITGLPFDEALLKLVSDSGFNVVVGEGVESGEINLNFTHKDLSLKSALDLLCMAYDLTYTVEDDAIVVRHK